MHSIQLALALVALTNPSIPTPDPGITVWRFPDRTDVTVPGRTIQLPVNADEAAISRAVGELLSQPTSAAPAVLTTAILPAAPMVNDALAEVNAARARRGLRPYLPDPGLAAGAQQAAQVRASRGITGHLPNDFAMLPPGTSASAGGCGAMDASWGFQACCQYDNYTYAGAATVRGVDGRMYHHLFVR